jgi:hypothetical protein
MMSIRFSLKTGCDNRPPIFVDEVMSPMNISGLYSSVMWPDRQIYGGRADGYDRRI